MTFEFRLRSHRRLRSSDSAQVLTRRFHVPTILRRVYRIIPTCTHSHVHGGRELEMQLNFLRSSPITSDKAVDTPTVVIACFFLMVNDSKLQPLHYILFFYVYIRRQFHSLTHNYRNRLFRELDENIISSL